MQSIIDKLTKKLQCNSFVSCACLRKFMGIGFLVVFSSAYTQCWADYSDHPQAQDFISKMQKEHGFSVAEVLRVLSAAEKKQAILDAISRPAEKTKKWFEYRKIFIQDSRIEQGLEFWQENEETLDRAYERFGVAPEIIVAIIGVETRYGRHAGTYRVIDALATLGFDYPPRGKFFSRELEQFMLLAREQKQDPLNLMGSYAGAMGYGQFISSSYRAYAVDFDGDKFADIWHNPVDAIGSVANYFRAHKWQKGEPIAMPATVGKAYNKALLNSRKPPQLSVAELKENGFALGSQASGPSAGQDSKAIPLSFVADDGVEYWLGFKNFYVITRYNRSRLYAMAVFELSQAIKLRHQQGGSPNPTRANDEKQNRNPQKM